MLSFANEFEGLIRNYGAQPAFPVTIAQGDTIAHWTPSKKCNRLFTQGLCIVDFGINYHGVVIDTALTICIGDAYRKMFEKKISMFKCEFLKMIAGLTTNSKFSDYARSTEKIANAHHLTPLKGLGGHNILPGKLHGDRYIPNSIESFEFAPDGRYDQGYYCMQPFLTPCSFETKSHIGPILQYELHGTIFYTCDRWPDYSMALKHGTSVSVIHGAGVIPVIQVEVCIHISKKWGVILLSD